MEIENREKQEKKKKKHYLTRYDGNVEDLFENAQLYTSFQSHTDVSWIIYIYYDCKVVQPFKNHCAKLDKGDFCQFVVYSERDDRRHFSLLCAEMGHKKKIKKLRGQLQAILDGSIEQDEDLLMQEIQCMAEDMFTFFNMLKKRKDKKPRLLGADYANK
jgi:hypothetical protein